MKPAEIREMSSEEMDHKQQELREELFNLKIQHATGQLENSARILKVRRDIARIKTILHSKSFNEGAKHA